MMKRSKVEEALAGIGFFAIILAIAAAAFGVGTYIDSWNKWANEITKRGVPVRISVVTSSIDAKCKCAARGISELGHFEWSGQEPVMLYCNCSQ